MKKEFKSKRPGKDLRKGTIIGANAIYPGAYDVMLSGSKSIMRGVSNETGAVLNEKDVVSIGFINANGQMPSIVGGHENSIISSTSTENIAQNRYPWQCFGRDAWNSNMSDYPFSWDASNPFAWEQTCGNAKNAVVATVNEKDYIYFNSTNAAVCIDEDKNLIWSATLPTITLPGTVGSAYSFLSDGKFYAVRTVYIDSTSNAYIVYDAYEIETGSSMGQIISTALPLNIDPNSEINIIKPTHAGEVISGYENHFFSTWRNKYLLDGTFSAFPANRAMTSNNGRAVMVNGYIITAQYDITEVDISAVHRFLTSVNSSDLLAANEFTIPYSYSMHEEDGVMVGDYDREHIQKIITAKDDDRTYIFVATRRNTASVSQVSEIIEEHTYKTVTTIISDNNYLYTFDAQLSQQSKIAYNDSSRVYHKYYTDGVESGEDVTVTSVADDFLLVQVFAVLGTKKLLCELYDTTAFKYVLAEIDPSTGSKRIIIDDFTAFHYGNGLNCITDSDENIIIIGGGWESQTCGYDTSGNILFTGKPVINTLAAGQNGVYGINYSTQRLYRL